MSAKAKNRLTPQQRKATLTRVLGKIRPYSLFVVCSLVVAAGSVGAQLYIPILCGDAIDLMLGNSACTNYYFELSSRARKWGAILTSITQHVRSVLNNEDARRMLSDCGYIKLLNQAPDDANDIARLLHISDEEKRYIENAEVGSGLLIEDKVVVPFNNTFPQDTELFRLMDTNPNRKK